MKCFWHWSLQFSVEQVIYHININSICCSIDSFYFYAPAIQCVYSGWGWYINLYIVTDRFILFTINALDHCSTCWDILDVLIWFIDLRTSAGCKIIYYRRRHLCHVSVSYCSITAFCNERKPFFALMFFINKTFLSSSIFYFLSFLTGILPYLLKQVPDGRSLFVLEKQSWIMLPYSKSV